MRTHAAHVRQRGLPGWVLAGLLLLGSVIGAQFGTKIAQLVKPEFLRLILASIVVAIALRMLWGLGVRPDEVYTVVPL